MFTKIVMQPQPELAKVNRKTGVLYLNPVIWDRLPTDQKDFVLLHEQGHLKLQTNDEFKAHKYAISKFSPVGQLSNKQLGQKIIVMRSALSKAHDNISPFTDPQMADATGGIFNTIFQALPVLGIGSKSRQAELQASAAANVAILGAQMEADAEKSQKRNKTIIISGVILLVIVVTFLTLRK
jgi:hypothetical protein